MRFTEFYLLPAARTTANFVAHLRTGVRNLTSEEAGYANALQRSDVQPTGRISGYRGRGGRGCRGTPYVKVFIDPSFMPHAGTKNCWFHGYKIKIVAYSFILSLFERYIFKQLLHCTLSTFNETYQVSMTLTCPVAYLVVP